MPETGLNWFKTQQLFSTQEVFQLLEILKQAGISKLRFTGGEPTLRSDFKEICEFAFSLQFEHIALTTNGTYSPELSSWLTTKPWHSINFSLDALNQNLFEEISKRKNYELVLFNLHELLKTSISTKINCVLIDGVNDQSLYDMIEFAKSNDVQIRFIEEMPFNGKAYRHAEKWSALRIQNELKRLLPDLVTEPFLPNATAQIYSSKALQGKLGIIAAFTRSFCGTCNRLRITPEGFVKTCLYAPPSLNLKQLIREKRNNSEIIHLLHAACLNKPKDGFAAESMHASDNFQSMATVGG